VDKEDLKKHALRISKEAQINYPGSIAQAKEFFRTYAGSNNSFLEALDKINNRNINLARFELINILGSFINYVQNDLLRISIERQIQIDTVSDYLEQAEKLLKDDKVHPAAPAVLIGASLEEFLRNWIEAVETDMTLINKSLDSYSSELKRRNLITKQDVKDIVSWGGIRNDAAHGHWDLVNDQRRIFLMLEGVNLFMRKYSVK